ncbi:hypothetical protein [Sphingopyxis panaciterrae]
MSLAFDRFLVRETIAIAAFNAGMNAAYTSWLWSRLPTLSLGGPAGIATDLAATPMFIGFLSALLGTAAIRKKLATGAVMLPRAVPGDGALARLPRGIFARASVLALLAMVAFSVPLFAAMTAAEGQPITLGEGVVVKVVLTILFSIVLVPLTVLAAGVDAARASNGRPRGDRNQSLAAGEWG